MDNASLWHDRRVENILFANLDALSKVRRIMDLGYDEESAGEMVEYYQLGQRAPVYYERLPIEYDTDQG